MSKIARLMVCQTVDRARGSFIVNPIPTGKKLRVEGEVYRGSNHTRRVRQPQPHQMATDFVIVQ